MPDEVRRNDERSRYEIRLDGSLAGYADYHDRGDAVVFTHTLVQPEYGGRGLGTELVRHALDDMRAQGRPIVPRCSFVAAFVADHPEYQPLVAG